MLIITSVGEVVPVFGNDSNFFTPSALASVVLGVLVVGVVATATGVPLMAFDAIESPAMFVALIVTEYVVPLVSPEIVNGLAVNTGDSAL